MPKALVPFCSYQGAMLGKKLRGNQNLTACDKFQPSVLNGQLCFSLNLSQVVPSESKSGKQNSVTIVLDQPASLQLIDQKNLLASIHLDTLAGFSDNRPGKYHMINLKMMTGSDAFMSLSDSEKGCQLESYEECEREKIFAALQRDCKCTPFAFAKLMKVQFFNE